ncbi:MAG: C39 family peptidase [Pseudomonadota bacterium]
MKRLVIPAALLFGLLGQARAMELPLPGGMRAALPVASIKAIRFETTVRQRYDFSCGSAALATLLSHHYAHPVSEKFVFEQMYRRGDRNKIRRQGFSLLDMQRFLRTRGFKADGFALPLDKLLEAGLPAIVLVSDKGYHHFVVVKGIAGGRVLIGDPSSGTRAMPRAAFEQIWRSKLLFVIRAWRGPVRFNGADDWRAAPAAPLAEGIARNGLGAMTLPKLGPGDF